MKNMIERFNVMTVTENSVHVTVKMKEYQKAILYADGGGKKFKDTRIENNNLHRFAIDGLKPDEDYALKLYVGENLICEKAVRTLRKPEGKVLAKFAILADIHYSAKNENRKGRLFIEVPSILNGIVDELNKGKFDFAVCPGDLTNEGIEEEYRGVKDVLDRLDMPYHPVAGDHDIRHVTDAGRLWNKYFGETTGVFRESGLTFIKLDTSSLVVSKKQRDWLHDELKHAKDKVVLLTHHQLFPDSYVLDKNKVIRNHEDLRPLLESCSDKIKDIYAGHKNVPSRSCLDTIMQLNCPQLSQFPCGYMVVRVYENGWYHNFANIKSEYLNECSRMDAHRLKRDIWNWKYRLGRDHKQWNFVL